MAGAEAAIGPGHLPLILRAFPKSKRRKRQRKVPTGWSSHVLLVDTETTTDPTQRLLFGSYQWARWIDGELVLLEEGLFAADELPERDPTGYAVLRDYAIDNGLKFYSRRDFLHGPFWDVAHETRATVVGFNLPFDLSRLAVSWSEARGQDRGAFSFTLWDRRDVKGEGLEDKYHPRLIINHIDSKRAFIRFKGGRDIPKSKRTRGSFLDLRTLAFALTNEAYSLQGACDAFGIRGKSAVERHGVITPEYIDYNRDDVRATRELCAKLRREFDSYPIKLDPCLAYSPASIAKACLDAMGIRSPYDRFTNVPDEVHGYAMTAYYGGRADVRVRRELVPVTTVDFLSMYPTVNALMGTWGYLTAEDLTVADRTDEVRSLLEQIDLNDCFAPDAWKGFVFLAEIDPDDDILPVRTEYDQQNRNIGVNRLTKSADPVWYTGPDLVASKLLTGRAPKVRKAIGLRPHGRTAGLKEIDFGYEVRVDPASGDAFTKLIELRKSLKQRGLDERTADRIGVALKIIANSGAYGVLAEMNVRDRTANDPATVHGLADFDTDAEKTEDPGRFMFPYIAAMTTGAARLMLAMLERCVTDQGGSYAFCDTDAMAILASREGGSVDLGGEFVRVLTWADVDAVRERFAHLNFYDPSIIRSSILQLDKENGSGTDRRQLLAWAISAKRYVLFFEGMEIAKPSEHGLGHLLNPENPDAPNRDWIDGAWRWITETEANREVEEPAWFDRLALTRITASSPALLAPFRQVNDGRAYADQIKPFNFLLSAHVAPFGHPVGCDPTRFHLTTRYERDPTSWAKLEWFEQYSAQVVPVTTRLAPIGKYARVQSIRDVVETFALHPEVKSASIDGLPCARDTRGLLHRRRIVATSVEYTGKESHEYEAVDQGLVHDKADVSVTYGSDEWDRLKGGLHDFSAAELARVAGVDPRMIKYYRAGEKEPRAAVKRRLIEFFRRAKSRAG